jgi:hypothetical protein
VPASELYSSFERGSTLIREVVASGFEKESVDEVLLKISKTTL